MNRLIKGLAAPLAFALVIAACSSSDSDGGSGDDAVTTEAPSDDSVADTAGGESPQAAGIARAQEVVEANTTEPTKIGPTIPLDSVPEPKTVAWLECSLPSCAAPIGRVSGSRSPLVTDRRNGASS